MAIDRTRYRQLDFQGARILQARELNWLQEMDQGVQVDDNSTPVSGQLQSIYRQGAMKNVTVGISGLVVTLSATDGAKPMEIFVRDRWEIFPGNNDTITDSTGSYAANHTLTLTNVNTNVFLNWELKIRSGGLVGDDPALTDAITNEEVAKAGELILHLSNVDTSGVSLSGSQLAKNVSPISLLNFTNSGSVLTLVPQDNVLTSAKASSKTAGLVKTTTDNSIVVSTDDSRMGVATVSVADGLVHDSTVRTPIAPGGTNSDGTPVYNLVDIGGINAAKIVYVAGTQLVSDFLGWIKTQFTTLKTRFDNHETAALGLVNTHPVPTAAQVGAAPQSHVGQALNLVTSHPAVVNQDSGGFRANRSGGSGSVDDPAYGVFVSGSAICALDHNGDIRFSKDGFSSPSVTSGGGLTASGSLDHVFKMATILRDHVNQQSHANPHGLSADDIGAASIAYVDAGVANAIAVSEAYTDSLTGVGVNRTTHRTGVTVTPDSANNVIPQNTSTVFMDYKIYRFGQHFEIAVGSGYVLDQQPVPLPEASGWSTVQASISVSPSWVRTHYDGDTVAVIAASYNSGTNIVTVREFARGHTPNFGNCWAGAFAIFYRSL